MSVAELFLLATLGGLLGLDTVSFPQAMLSRPIVASTLTGILLGEPERGLLLGATLELFALETLPFGASRYPEWGSASTVGAALFVPNVDPQMSVFFTAVLATLLWAWFGGWTMTQLRRLNARWAHQRHDAVAQGNRRVVIGLQLYGLTADLARGVIVTAVGLLALMPAQRLVLSRWPLEATSARIVVTAAAATVALGAVWIVFRGTSFARWLFALGLVVGLALVFRQ
jgi:mannose/fructose/N-acetylgalactosamine-specific phosphotransferase system component IIC